jgi:hypothetical protein
MGKWWANWWANFCPLILIYLLFRVSLNRSINGDELDQENKNGTRV